MIRANLIIGLALMALGAGAAAQQNSQPQENQSQDKKRDPQSTEIWRLAGEVILNGIERAGDHFVTVGARGVVLLSEDGAYWHQVKMPTRTMLTRVVFYNERIGWAVGWDGAILRTTDGGENWKLVRWEPKWGEPYLGILPTGPQSAMVVGQRGRVLRTSDGGKTWNRLRAKVFKVGFHFFDIQRVGHNGIILPGERGMIALSLDGGKTWKMVKPPYPGSYFGALRVGEWGVVLYGLEGEVYYAPDVRDVSILEKPLSYSPFTSQQITDPQKLAKMGWKHIDLPKGVNNSLFGGVITDDRMMVLVGKGGTVVYGTVHSGKLKLAENSPTAAALSDVMVLEDRWLLTGGGSGLYKMPAMHDQTGDAAESNGDSSTTSGKQSDKARRVDKR